MTSSGAKVASGRWVGSGPEELRLPKSFLGNFLKNRSREKFWRTASKKMVRLHFFGQGANATKKKTGGRRSLFASK